MSNQNYSSTISLHSETIDGKTGTLAIESFVVDVPEGNTKEETCFFVEALIQCNLNSLADVTERLQAESMEKKIWDVTWESFHSEKKEKDQRREITLPFYSNVYVFSSSISIFWMFVYYWKFVTKWFRIAVKREI